MKEKDMQALTIVSGCLGAIPSAYLWKTNDLVSRLSNKAYRKHALTGVEYDNLANTRKNAYRLFWLPPIAIPVAVMGLSVAGGIYHPVSSVWGAFSVFLTTFAFSTLLVGLAQHLMTISRSYRLWKPKRKEKEQEVDYDSEGSSVFDEAEYEAMKKNPRPTVGGFRQ